MKGTARRAGRALGPTLASAASLALALNPSLARADQPPALPRLSWVRGRGAEACPDGARLQDAVSRELTANAVGPARVMPSVEGVVERDGAEWVARIFVRDASDALVGQREIRSAAPSCDSVAAAVGLAVALLVASDPADPTSPATASTPAAATGASPGAAGSAPARAPQTPAAPTPRVPPSTAPRAPGPRSARTMELRGMLAGVATVGTLPGVAGGTGLVLEASPVGPLRVQVGARWFPEVRGGTEELSFAFGGADGWAALCVEALRRARFSLAGCAGARVGAVHAVPLGPLVGVPAAGAEHPWVGALLGVQGAVTLVGPLAVELGLQLDVPLLRYAFAVQSGDDPAVVFAQSPVAGGAWLGLGVELR